MVQNTKVIFNEIPHGEPVIGKTLKTVTEEFDIDNIQLKDGEVLVRVVSLSLDPYQRGRLRDPSIKSYVDPFKLSEPINNSGVARILKSKNSALSEGRYYYGFLPFVDYAVLPTGYEKQLKDVTNNEIPYTTYTGALGMPGRTAYMSLVGLFKPVAGESIFVSAASGAVGQLVVQFAKQFGLKVLASAGSDDKVQFCKEIGADQAFNYKKSDTAQEIRKFGGIDVFYDNVGGPTLATVLNEINPYGKIIACGAISQYNATEPYGITNTFQIVAKKLTIKGFIVFDLIGQYENEFIEKVPPMVKSGQVKIKEHIIDGLVNAETGFLGMLKGENFGKAVVKLE